MDFGGLFAAVGSGLPGYPPAVRIFGAVWLVATPVLLALVVYFKPTPAFVLDHLSRKTTAEGLAAFELVLRNPTAEPVAVNRVEMEFFRGEPPTAGLQSGRRERVTYRLILNDAGEVAAIDKDDLASEVVVRTPFESADYTRFSLDAGADLGPKETLRLLLVLRSDGLHPPGADTAAARVRYNAGETTDWARTALAPEG